MAEYIKRMAALHGIIITRLGQFDTGCMYQVAMPDGSGRSFTVYDDDDGQSEVYMRRWIGDWLSDDEITREGRAMAQGGLI